MEKPNDLTVDQLLEEYVGANELIDVLIIKGQISLAVGGRVCKEPSRNGFCETLD